MILNNRQPGGIWGRSMFRPAPTCFGRGKPSVSALVSKMPAARLQSTCHRYQVPQRRRFQLQTRQFPIAIFPSQVSCGALSWPAQQATPVPGKPPREPMEMGAVCLCSTCWCLSGSCWTGACLDQHRLMLFNSCFRGRFSIYISGPLQVYGPWFRV